MFDSSRGSHKGQSGSDSYGCTHAPWIFNAESTTYTTSDTFFRRCLINSSCAVYTGCSSGYLLAEGTSSYCGILGATPTPDPSATSSSQPQYCSSHILVPSLSASHKDAKSWFWCDSAPLTGCTLYAQEPAEPTFPTSSAPTSPSTSSLSPTTPAPSTPATTTTPPRSDKSSATSPIIGASIGGLVIILTVGLSIYWTIRHDRRKRQITQERRDNEQRNKLGEAIPMQTLVGGQPTGPAQLDASIAPRELGAGEGRMELPAEGK
ncbi:hypothetical protein NX059_002654 [Plenodomus lindquistii]|nr:hypothetical protein NX059_002654 [Plenodomus lindquistii]